MQRPKFACTILLGKRPALRGVVDRSTRLVRVLLYPAKRKSGILSGL